MSLSATALPLDTLLLTDAALLPATEATAEGAALTVAEALTISIPLFAWETLLLLDLTEPGGGGSGPVTSATAIDAGAGEGRSQSPMTASADLTAAAPEGDSFELELGAFEGVFEGAFEGVLEGALEGASEGAFEGALEGVFDAPERTDIGTRTSTRASTLLGRGFAAEVVEEAGGSAGWTGLAEEALVVVLFTTTLEAGAMEPPLLR